MDRSTRLREWLIRQSHALSVDSGYRWVARQRADGPLGRVLTFHDVTGQRVDGFERILERVTDAYTLVDLPSLVAYATGRERPPSDGTILVAITFDDGFGSWTETVVPMLRKRGVPATFFISSGFVDAETRSETAAFARDRLRRSPTRSLDWADVRSLADDPLFTIGSHTHTHADLGSLARSAIERELAIDCDRIKTELGSAPSLFAYPFGGAENVSPVAKHAVADAGFDAAFTIRPGFVTSNGDRLTLPRDSFDPILPRAALEARLSGAYDPIKGGIDVARGLARRLTGGPTGQS